MTDTKTCRHCGETKSSEQFPKNKRVCKPCHKIRYKDVHQRSAKEQNRRRREDPERKQQIRYQAIKRSYNISSEEYEEMKQQQNYLCLICKHAPEEEFSIDHDHSCCPERSRSCGNCIRGLLCNSCNQVIGFFKDDISTVQSAIDYLTKYSYEITQV